MDDSSYKNLFVVLNRNYPEINIDNFLKVSKNETKKTKLTFPIKKKGNKF